MLYELRVFDVVPGKLPALNDRFEHVTMPIFEKYGMKVVGFWTDEIGTSNRLTLMLAFEDAAQRAKAWASFSTDHEWIAKSAESERDGPLIAKITNTLMAPTSYSPMK